MVALAREVVAGKLSVRQTEARVRDGARPARRAAQKTESPNVRHLREALQRSLGARVQLHERGGAGSIEIHYSSLDELDRLVERLSK